MKLRWLACVVAFTALDCVVACGSDSSPSDAPAPTSDAGTSAGGAGATAGAGEASNDAGAPAGGVSSAEAGSSGASEAGQGGVAGAESALTLISATPAPDAENASFHDPIELVFSHPLDPKTVTGDSVSLEISGNALAASVTLSADRTKVIVQASLPPIMPSTVTIHVTDLFRDDNGNSFAGETWSWQWPLWQSLGSPTEALPNLISPAIALDGNEQPVIAWLQDAAVGSPLQVSRWAGSEWTTLGKPLNVSRQKIASAPSLVVGADGQPVVAWSESTDGTAGSVHVARWNGSAWALLGDAALGTSVSAPLLALDSKSQPVIAWQASATELDVLRWTVTGWQALTTPLVLASDEFHGFAFTLSADLPVVAYYDTNQDVSAKSFTGTSWVSLGKVSDRERTTSVGRPSISAASDGTLYVGYIDGDPVSNNCYVRRLAPAGVSWVAEDAALDVSLDSEVTSMEVRATSDGPVAAWAETYEGATKVYAARFKDSAFQLLGPAIASNGPLATGIALSVDSHGNPNVLYQAPAGLGVARYNGSPETPYGLTTRASIGGCAIPDDASPAFPQTLTATGCYTDVAKDIVNSGAIPYEINSPLWSDGATKHRFIVLPEQSTIGYTSTGAWTMPVGTIIIKEFLYQAETTDPASLYPMETRFLVKRCEEGMCPKPWQGYSYQWNASGTEANLLPATATTKDWPYATSGVAQTPHTHTYPARSECVRCHNASVGRTLGLQTPQLNRSHDYGQTIDNELRAFDHIGLFGTTFPKAPAAPFERLPTPHDPSFPLAQRARAYFHANCAHCHNPAGECPQIDFRYDGTGLTQTNICNELVVGQPLSSELYVRDSSRNAGVQMPPLATLIPDARELPITASWISSLTACP
jgi:hypothetical protein